MSLAEQPVTLLELRAGSAERVEINGHEIWINRCDLTRAGVTQTVRVKEIVICHCTIGSGPVSRFHRVNAVLEDGEVIDGRMRGSGLMPHMLSLQVVPYTDGEKRMMAAGVRDGSLLDLGPWEPREQAS